MHSRSRLPLAVAVAVAGLLSGCTGGAAEPVPMPTVDYTAPDGSDGSDEASTDQALVLSECGTVRARPGDARRTEYLTDPVVARVGRGEEYDLSDPSPAPATLVGAAVTTPRAGAGDVEVSRSLERRIARAAGVQVGLQIEASEDSPGNTFTNTGPERDFAILDYVRYRVGRWSADDCLAFPGETVRGTLVHDMVPGDAILSCVPDERPRDDLFEPVLRELCPG